MDEKTRAIEAFSQDFEEQARIYDQLRKGVALIGILGGLATTGVGFYFVAKGRRQIGLPMVVGGAAETAAAINWTGKAGEQADINRRRAEVSAELAHDGLHAHHTGTEQDGALDK
jgi:hypothetical protein